MISDKDLPPAFHGIIGDLVEAVDRSGAQLRTMQSQLAVEAVLSVFKNRLGTYAATVSKMVGEYSDEAHRLRLEVIAYQGALKKITEDMQGLAQAGKMASRAISEESRRSPR